MPTMLFLALVTPVRQWSEKRGPARGGAGRGGAYPWAGPRAPASLGGHGGGALLVGVSRGGACADAGSGEALCQRRKLCWTRRSR